MYLQTSRLQYNLQKVGVFQTAHSDKNIQAKACKSIIAQKYRQLKHTIDKMRNLLYNIDMQQVVYRRLYNETKPFWRKNQL